jgi:para-aminobenzoate synthetase component 1
MDRFYRIPAAANAPPFQGGIAGLFGYGLGNAIERLPMPRPDALALPDLALGCYDWVYAYDHETAEGWLITTGWPEREENARREHAWRRMQAIKRLLQNDSPAFPPHPASVARPELDVGNRWSLPNHPGVWSNFSTEQYCAMVARGVEYVRAGDCFQVNLAQRLSAPLREHPAELYLRLRERNPAPFAAYFDLGDLVIASASPERFLQMDAGGWIETRPIKGTRSRHHDSAIDRALQLQLLSSAKDRAENVMIVDLLRNDLGRVCRYGSISVDALCRLESYQTVHHLVSVVRGRLRAGLGAADLIRATFPGGSVTGAPKIRAMEIIAELEPHARGAYCGSLGYLSFTGDLDLNILIRTFTAASGWLTFPVGGGIVADSDPAREYDETLHKAAGLLAALMPFNESQR